MNSEVNAVKKFLKASYQTAVARQESLYTVYSCRGIVDYDQRRLVVLSHPTFQGDKEISKDFCKVALSFLERKKSDYTRLMINDGGTYVRCKYLWFVVAIMPKLGKSVQIGIGSSPVICTGCSFGIEDLVHFEEDLSVAEFQRWGPSLAVQLEPT